MERIEFLFDALNATRHPNVLDVGANPLDKPAYSDLVDLNLCNLFAFEPQEEAFHALIEAKRPNETYFNAAVGHGEAQRLHLCKHSGFTSLHRPDLECAKIFPGFASQMSVGNRVNITPIELDAIENLPPQDMLKIDVQGAEKQVIQTGKRTLVDCVAIVIECRFARLYHAEPMVGEVDTYLRDQGFMIHKFISPKSACLNNSYLKNLRPRLVGSQLVDGDIVYIKDITALHTFSDDQLKYLTLFSDAVFNSIDLVFFLLDELMKREVIAKDVLHAYFTQLPDHLKR